MPGAFFKTNDKHDDVHREGPSFYWDTGYLTSGKKDSAICETALRFPGVTIPQGSKITKAKLWLYAYEKQQTREVHLRIRCEKSAAPPQIADWADFEARPRTDHCQDWNFHTYAPKNAWFYSPDFSEEVQEVLDAYPFTDYPIMIFVRDHKSPSNHHRTFISNQIPGPSQPALELDWIPPLIPPPQLLWLIVDHGGYWDGKTLTIHAVTDRPCHLTMQYQQAGIVIHPRIKIRRGIPSAEDPHLGFDNYLTQDQAEAGDTLDHTFSLEYPYICKTYYWQFVGTIGSIASLSKSPVFSWHLTEEMRVGHYSYWSFQRPGAYHTSPGTGSGLGAAMSLSDNKLYAIPFYHGALAIVTRIAIYVTAIAAGKKARLGIYEDNGLTYPGDLLIDAGEVSLGSTGQKDIMGLNVPLLENSLYWLALISEGTPGIACLHGYYVISIIGCTRVAYSESSATHWAKTQAYGTLPLTFPSGATPLSELVPNICVFI